MILCMCLAFLLGLVPSQPDSGAHATNGGTVTNAVSPEKRFGSELRGGIDGLEFQTSFFLYPFTSADFRIGSGPSITGIAASVYPVKYVFGQIGFGLPRYNETVLDAEPFKPDYYYSYRLGGFIPLGKSQFYFSASAEKMWMVDTRNCVNCGFMTWSPGTQFAPQYRRLSKIINSIYFGIGWRF